MTNQGLEPVDVIVCIIREGRPIFSDPQDNRPLDLLLLFRFPFSDPDHS